MAVVGVAPCQCFSPGANQTTSPGRISSIGPALALDPAAAGGDDQGLAERVGVPGRAGAGLEGDAGAGHPGGIGRLEEAVDPDGAGEPVRLALCPRAASRLRLISMEPLLADRAQGASPIRMRRSRMAER